VQIAPPILPSRTGSPASHCSLPYGGSSVELPSPLFRLSRPLRIRARRLPRRWRPRHRGICNPTLLVEEDTFRDFKFDLMRMLSPRADEGNAIDKGPLAPSNGRPQANEILGRGTCRTFTGLAGGHHAFELHTVLQATQPTTGAMSASARFYKELEKSTEEFVCHQASMIRVNDSSQSRMPQRKS
jgi:hypothetical protein